MTERIICGDIGGVVEHSSGGVYSMDGGEPPQLRPEAILTHFGELHFQENLGGGLQSKVTNEWAFALRNE